MKIIYRFTNHFSADDVTYMASKGYKVTAGFDVVLIPSDDSSFKEIKEYLGDEAVAMPEITYTPKELNSAQYLKIWANKYLGYAKPDIEEEVEEFEYPFDIYPHYKNVFEIEKTDPNYGVLRGKQIGSFQMKGKPKWGKSSIASLFGGEDCFFVTEYVYKTIFEPLGIKSKPVINYSNKKVLENIVQIMQEGVSESPMLLIPNYIKEEYKVQSFGISKYLVNGACPPPLFKETPGSMNFFYTQEYFGSSGVTKRSSIITQKLYQMLKENKVKGLSFAPLMEYKIKSTDNSLFLSEKDDAVYKRFKGKNYTKEEWEAYEKEQWDKYNNKN